MRFAPRLATGVAIATLAAGALAATPASAQEYPLPVVCPGTVNTVFTPGLTLEPRQVTAHFDANYLCGATSIGQAKIDDATCVDLSLPENGEELKWLDTNANSRIHYTTVVAARVAEGVLVTQLGTVTSGRYEGSPVKKEVLSVTNQQLEVECLTEEGLETTSSEAVLTIGNLL